MRPYCSIFNEPDIETLIKLGVRESLVVLHLAAELSLNPVCKLSSTAPKASSSSLETEWVLGTKGQLISECPFNILNFPKKQRKNLTNF